MEGSLAGDLSVKKIRPARAGKKSGIRRDLEKIFFHDVLNIAAALKNVAHLLPGCKDPQARKDCETAFQHLAQELVAEIRAQEQLIAAGEGELSPRLAATSTVEVLGHCLACFGRELAMAPSAECISLVTDPSILSRVLINMVKNALEASWPGARVTLGANRAGSGVRFWVHNPGHMTGGEQERLFSFPFSTKGASRGNGCRSMVLLGERCLGGRVFLCSAPGHGTTVSLILPGRPD